MAFQGDSIYWVEVEKIVPNPFQPRREFDEQKLRELADSVRMYGILQPLTVTRNEIQREDGTFYTEYELIAGERRLRASKLAGLTQVPVIIREGEDSEQEKLELAIIENLQREDLNAVDRALAFRQLAEVFGLSHVHVAKKVGRSREYVSNSIRLLGLPEYMLNSLRLAEMTEGHARTLLMLNDRPEEQDVVFREILLKKLSVREVERIVRKIATDKVRKKNSLDFDTELIEIEKRFMETLGTRVQILKTDYGGRLTIDYFSVDDLESMLKRMKTDVPPEGAELEARLANLVNNTPLAYAAVPQVVSAALPTVLPPTEPYVEEGRFDELMSATDESIITDEISSPGEVMIDSEMMSVDPVADYAQRDYFTAADLGSVPEVAQPIVSPYEAEVTEVSAMTESITLPPNEEKVEAMSEEVEAISNLNDDNIVESQFTAAEEVPEAPVADNDDDDSDLYAIRHFGV